MSDNKPYVRSGRRNRNPLPIASAGTHGGVSIFLADKTSQPRPPIVQVSVGDDLDRAVPRCCGTATSRSRALSPAASPPPVAPVRSSHRPVPPPHRGGSTVRRSPPGRGRPAANRPDRPSPAHRAGQTEASVDFDATEGAMDRAWHGIVPAPLEVPPRQRLPGA
jgi:hypothetical protein